MIKRGYYNKYKNQKDSNILEYFECLNLQDWIDFFDDYYREQIVFLLRIFDCPKGENVYSYGLIRVQEVSSNTKDLIAKAHESLFVTYYHAEKHDDLLKEFYNTVRYLKLEISQNLFFKIIESEKESDKIRKSAALTLIQVNENSNVSFWDNLDLEKDKFLIPAYIAFYRNNNPVKGLRKLSILEEKPDTFAYESPIVSSLKTKTPIYGLPATIPTTVIG